MSGIDSKKWRNFKTKHEKAKKHYWRRYPTGIGTKTMAVAEYMFRKVEEDITDYDSW